MPVLSKHLLLKLINCVQTRARLMAPTPELLAHECWWVCVTIPRPGDSASLSTGPGSSLSRVSPGSCYDSGAAQCSILLHFVVLSFASLFLAEITLICGLVTRLVDYSMHFCPPPVLEMVLFLPPSDLIHQHWEQKNSLTKTNYKSY